MNRRSFPGLASKYRCTGCMVCVDACRFGALKSEIRTDGHLYPTVEITRCTGCGACRRVCPVLSRSGHTQQPGTSRPYAAWANDESLRMRSASGGIFAALATQILQEGGSVAGAVMEGTEVRHALIDRAENLFRLQGSKYQQGDSSGIYRATLEALQKGKKVLFSGTGCQIGGLLSFLASKTFSGKLYTVDLVCGGFPSILPMRNFIDHADKPVRTIKAFRDKTTGWKSIGYSYCLKTLNTDGTESDYGSKNLVLGAFNSHLTNRYSCLNCRFAKAHRPSDLTIADFWGDTDYPEEHFKGVSVTVVHTPAGEALFKASNITTYPTTWNKFVFHNPRMITGKDHFLRFHPARIFLAAAFAHLPYALLRQLYHGTPPVSGWKLYRALGVLMVRWSHAINLKTCRHIVERLNP